MELNKKLRGQKHHYNKQRYQNKAKVVQKSSPEKGASEKNKVVTKETPESEKGLTSNWHYYEEPPEDDEIDESTNFSLLAQAPISHGGHFQFKSDKNIESEFDFESLRSNKMFSLDLHLLQSSLSTIPFHQRCGLDEHCFTEEQLGEIRQRSRQNVAQYESNLRINVIAKDFVAQSISNKESNTCEDQPGVKNRSYNELKLDVPQVDVVEVSREHRREVETADSLTAQPELEENKEDLEQWLDDILSN